MIKPLEVVVIAFAFAGLIANAVLLGATLLTYVCWAVAIVALVPGCIRWIRARSAKRRPRAAE